VTFRLWKLNPGTICQCSTTVASVPPHTGSHWTCPSRWQILYYMWTGQKPFDTTNRTDLEILYSIANGARPDPSPLPPPLAALLTAMWEVEPAARPSIQVREPGPTRD
jgi:hypothetical protein